MSLQRTDPGLDSSQTAIQPLLTTLLAQETRHSEGLDEVCGEARPRLNPSRRRDKPQLSCHLCRRRK